MHIGAVFPQTEFPPDPGAVREYAQTAEALGYSHIVAYDHVLGANPDRPGGWSGLYTRTWPSGLFKPIPRPARRHYRTSRRRRWSNSLRRAAAKG